MAHRPVTAFIVFKKLPVIFMALLLPVAFAAVDVNQATEAELDGIKGLGPATSRIIIAERKKFEFKDWADFMNRVKGVKSKSASKFSAEGLRVNGESYLVGQPLVATGGAVKD